MVLSITSKDPHAGRRAHKAHTVYVSDHLTGAERSKQTRIGATQRSTGWHHGHGPSRDLSKDGFSRVPKRTDNAALPMKVVARHITVALWELFRHGQQAPSPSPRAKEGHSAKGSLLFDVASVRVDFPNLEQSPVRIHAKNKATEGGMEGLGRAAAICGTRRVPYIAYMSCGSADTGSNRGCRSNGGLFAGEEGGTWTARMHH